MVKRATETSNLLYYFGLAKLKDAQGVTLNAAFQKYGKHDETAESRQFCELFGFMQGLSEAFFVTDPHNFLGQFYNPKLNSDLEVFLPNNIRRLELQNLKHNCKSQL